VSEDGIDGVSGRESDFKWEGAGEANLHVSLASDDDVFSANGGLHGIGVGDEGAVVNYNGAALRDVVYQLEDPVIGVGVKGTGAVVFHVRNKAVEVDSSQVGTSSVHSSISKSTRGD